MKSKKEIESQKRKNKRLARKRSNIRKKLDIVSSVNPITISDSVAIQFSKKHVPKKFMILDYKHLVEIKEDNIEEEIEKNKEKLKKEVVINSMHELAKSVNEHLSSKFIFTEQISDILTTGYILNKNILLYGRGGHAKSEMVEEFFKFHNIDPFTLSCGEGLTEDKLFGGLDMKKFKDHGVVEYNLDHSFANHEYVVFEELLDAPISVLLSLKDVLTSGYVRQGSQSFKIKTKLVIALTNRTREEVSEDNSIKALMERFPLELKVEWNKYTNDEFQQLFSKVKKDSCQPLAKIIEFLHDKGTFVSPRTAIHSYDVYKASGVKGLGYVAGFDTSMIADIEIEERKIRAHEEMANKLTKIRDTHNYVQTSMDISRMSFTELHSFHKLYGYFINKINGMTINDKLYDYRNTIIKECEEYMVLLLKQAEILNDYPPATNIYRQKIVNFPF